MGKVFICQFKKKNENPLSNKRVPNICAVQWSGAACIEHRLSRCKQGKGLRQGILRARGGPQVNASVPVRERRGNADTGDRSHETKGTETAVMWPQAQGHWDSPEAGTGRKDLSQGLPAGAQPCDTLIQNWERLKTSLLFHAGWRGVSCYGSHGKRYSECPF